MTVATLAFYGFALAVIAGGLFTVIARNPVHSVLWRKFYLKKSNQE